MKKMEKGNRKREEKEMKKGIRLMKRERKKGTGYENETE